MMMVALIQAPTPSIDIFEISTVINSATNVAIRAELPASAADCRKVILMINGWTMIMITVKIATSTMKPTGYSTCMPSRMRSAIHTPSAFDSNARTILAIKRIIGRSSKIGAIIGPDGRQARLDCRSTHCPNHRTARHDLETERPGSPS